MNKLKVPLNLTKTKTLILVYHGVVKNNPLKYNSRFISANDFEKHILFFKNNCVIKDLKDLDKQSTSNKLNIIITFDDGYLNNLKYAIPILQKHQVPATFCISTQHKFPILWMDFIDIISEEIHHANIEFKGKVYTTPKDKAALKNDLIKANKAEIKSFLNDNVAYFNKIKVNKSLDDYWKLLDKESLISINKNPLFEIIPHGHYHLSQKHINTKESLLEIESSMELIKKITKQEVLSWALPFGHYKKPTIELLDKKGITKVLALDKLPHDFSDKTISRFVINPHINFNLQKRFIVKGKYF